MALLSPRVSEFIYTVLLRPRLLRKIANRCLLWTIPEKVRVDGLDLYLNPNDPVLSPAVAMGVYEPWERELFRDLCRPGMTVVDLGANVGLYTLIAAAAVGPTGSVVAVEPDFESYCFLTKSIGANHLAQVKAFNVACGNKSGRVDLFHAEDNRADSRLYDSTGSRKKTEVKMVTLDGLLTDQGINRVDLIKMDIQGAEGLALEGMLEVLKANHDVTLVCEYWPWGIQSAGGLSPHAFLESLVSLGFTLKSIDETARRLFPVEDVPTLIEMAAATEYTSRTLQRSHYNFVCRRPQQNPTPEGPQPPTQV